MPFDIRLRKPKTENGFFSENIYTPPTTENETADDDTAAYTENSGLVIFREQDKLFCAMTVIGQIEGHYLLSPQNKTTKYEHMLPRLLAVEQDPTLSGLLLIINTVGGDIEAGLAIAELIAGMRKPTVSLVLGGGHSIGVPLAVSADKSFIAKTAGMTIHPVRMTGMVAGAPQTFEYFRNIQERIVRFVSENSGIGADTFRSLMLSSGSLMNDLGTLLTGEEAVKLGLIDHVGTLSEAVACLRKLCE